MKFVIDDSKDKVQYVTRDLITVVIADDHTLVRQGMQALLAQSNNIDVVATAADGQEALNIVMRVKPDVVILDIAMPLMSGLIVAQKIARLTSEIRIVLVSSYARSGLVLKSRSIGAHGYVVKSSLNDDLVTAVEAVHEGGNFYSAAVRDFVEA